MREPIQDTAGPTLFESRLPPTNTWVTTSLKTLELSSSKVLLANRTHSGPKITSLDCFTGSWTIELVYLHRSFTEKPQLCAASFTSCSSYLEKTLVPINSQTRLMEGSLLSFGERPNENLRQTAKDRLSLQNSSFDGFKFGDSFVTAAVSTGTQIATHFDRKGRLFRLTLVVPENQKYTDIQLQQLIAEPLFQRDTGFLASFSMD